MENTIKIRIQKLMELEQLNPASFAKAIQVNPSAISHILNDRNKPSTDIIVKILNTFRSIDSNWLVLGVGSMYRNESMSSSPTTTSLFDSNSHLETNIVRTEPNPPYGTPVGEAAKKELMDSSPIAEEIKDIPLKPSKTVKKIIVYYSDNSFEEFNPSNK